MGVTRALIAALSAAASLQLASTLSSGGYGTPLVARSGDAFVDSIGINTHVCYTDTIYGA